MRASPGEADALTRRDTWWLTIVGRLKPGWTKERAAAQLRDNWFVFRDRRPELYGAIATLDGRAGS